MHYYEVYVSSSRYQKGSALTYEAEATYETGTVVEVSLQNKPVIGIVIGQVAKPEFKTNAIIKQLVDRPLPSDLLKLFNWLGDYYPAGLGMTTALFVPSGLLQTGRVTRATEAVGIKRKPVELPPLTGQQAEAVRKIESNKLSSVLLHGDTGTGKTRIYQEITANTLGNGTSIIMLTPEIGLTPQLVESFEAVFPNQVVVLHSHLTIAQRRTAWLQILNADQPLVVIGPRSALFAPLKSVGIIIIDEAHDSAYKQEQAPYYQTSRVAAKLAALHGGQLIMGTATPLVTDYYAFEAKQLPILRLTEKPVSLADSEPDIQVIELKDRQQFSRSDWLSDNLLQNIEAALEKEEQSLVFLNRRGTARLVLCGSCGWQALCPNCDLPLTYHGDKHIMLCHTCGFKATAPSSCPSCQSADITFRSIGTKALTDEIKRLFPKARVQRFDSDSLKAERLEEHYEAVQEGEVDIIVGTQLLTKGLDLPKLSAVGVVAADTSLYFPDYTAEERTYQMLTQVIGRVSRGHRTGKVIVQTYQSDSAAIRAAVANDYRQFYEQQIAERRLYRFPPFSYILKLSCKRATAKSAEKAGISLKEMLQQAALQISISGPSPAFIEKSHGKYHWQLIVRAKQRAELVKVIRLLPGNWTYDIDPVNLL